MEAGHVDRFIASSSPPTAMAAAATASLA